MHDIDLTTMRECVERTPFHLSSGTPPVGFWSFRDGVKGRTYQKKMGIVKLMKAGGINFVVASELVSCGDRFMRSFFKPTCEVLGWRETANRIQINGKPLGEIVVIPDSVPQQLCWGCVETVNRGPLVRHHEFAWVKAIMFGLFILGREEKNKPQPACDVRWVSCGRIMVPDIGTHLRLDEDWSFSLFCEYRNLSLTADVDRITGRSTAWGIGVDLPVVPFTIKAGAVLSVDRVYIRNGMGEFSSLTFKTVGEIKVEITGIEVVCQKKRFWVKLTDVNRMVVSVDESTMPGKKK